MAGTDERTYTAVEHSALLEAEVKHKTAELASQLDADKAKALEEVARYQSELTKTETEKAELLTKLDKVEAEKAALETAKAALAKEFEDYKGDLDRKAEIATLRTERLEKAKAALTSVGEDYFTDARIDRWAEMADEAFDTALADLVEGTGAVTTEKATVHQMRETAAFSSTGPEPTAANASGLSTFMQLQAAKRAQ